MARQGNAAPVIIKRKKNVVGGGHHGGAWKVAYADFVTAMMAFFLLMWLLNATTEKQRKGLADYFNPTIAANRISGGGDGSFGGDSVQSERTLAQVGTGATASRPTDDRQARGQDGGGPEGKAEDSEELLSEVQTQLLARSGESMTMERLLRHVVARVSDEGLVIEIFDLPEAALFMGDTAEPSESLRVIARVIAEVLGQATNAIAVNGHMRTYPMMMRENPVWPVSAERAHAVRELLQGGGLPAERFQRISGYADRKTVTPDPTVARNNRIEVVLLRRDR